VLRDVVVSSRPSQWIKNLVVFLPLLFSFNESWDLSNSSHVLQLLMNEAFCFFAFISASSSIYLLNDVFDAEKDRLHPEKKNRPVAKKSIGRRTALAACFILMLVSFGFTIGSSLSVITSIASYLVLMILYGIWFRNIFMLDVFCISAGFIIRVMAGAVAVDVPISPWLYVCMGFGALFIGLAKRMSESINVPEGIEIRRKSMNYYNRKSLGLLMTTVSSISLMSYCLYTFTATNLPTNNSMILTIPFVALGLFRYQFLVSSKGLGERPEHVFFKDKVLLSCLLVWLFCVLGVLYAFR